MLRLGSWLVPCALVCSACTGTIVAPEIDDPGEELCAGDENLPPAAPEVVAPRAGQLDIISGQLTVVTSGFDDPDQGNHTQTEMEIWRLAGSEPAIRVWSAKTDAQAKLTQLTLADGTFEVAEDLDVYADYAVRVRYRDSGECSAWSEWSPYSPFRTDDGSTYYFATDAIRDIHIHVPESSWQPLDDQAVPPACVPHIRRYYPGSVTIDGVTYDGVGIRTKGGCGSSRGLDGKASWKINLSWDDPDVEGCPAERRDHGLKRLTLNNQVQDRSFVHERLAYHFYKLMGVPTPRVNHVQVYVQRGDQPEELWGVYLNLESIDRRMLSRWFSSNKGMLYEGTYWCDIFPENVPPIEADSSPDDSTDFCISRKFHPNTCSPTDPQGDPETFAPIRTLADELVALGEGDSFYPEIEQIFDFDTFLSQWAVENIIGHWDGYAIDIINNYRVYHDPGSGKWTIIPTGVDQTFGQQTPLNQVAGQLAERCWNDSDCQAAFLARVDQALTVFEQANLDQMAANVRDQIAPYVQADPRKEGTVEQFQNQVEGTINFINARAEQVRNALP